MKINERIKYLRKDLLKLTQSAFGEKLGIGKSAISHIESGTSLVTEQNMKLICKEFHVNYIWLKEGEGEVFSTVEKSLIDRLTDEYELNPVQTRQLKKSSFHYSFKIKSLITCMTE